MPCVAGLTRMRNRQKRKKAKKTKEKKETVARRNELCPGSFAAIASDKTRQYKEHAHCFYQFRETAYSPHRSERVVICIKWICTWK